MIESLLWLPATIGALLLIGLFAGAFDPGGGYQPRPSEQPEDRPSPPKTGSAVRPYRITAPLIPPPDPRDPICCCTFTCRGAMERCAGVRCRLDRDAA